MVRDRELVEHAVERPEGGLKAPNGSWQQPGHCWTRSARTPPPWDAIATRAGVSVGSVYRFFANKNALWSTINARRRERMWETVGPQFTDDSPERDIEAAADEFVTGLRRVLDELPGAKGMLAITLREPPAARNAALWAVYQERLIAMHTPNLPPARRTVAAYTYQTITSAMILSAVHLTGAALESHLAEIRTVLVGYTRELARGGWPA